MPAGMLRFDFPRFPRPRVRISFAPSCECTRLGTHSYVLVEDPSRLGVVQARPMSCEAFLAWAPEGGLTEWVMVRGCNICRQRGSISTLPT